MQTQNKILIYRIETYLYARARCLKMANGIYLRMFIFHLENARFVFSVLCNMALHTIYIYIYNPPVGIQILI